MGNQPTYEDLMQQIVQLEEELQQQRQAYDDQTQTRSLFLSLIDSLPLNIFSKDKKGRFILANRQYCQTVGKSMEEILGRTDDDFHPPEMARKYRRDDRTVMDSRQVTALEEEHRTIAGTTMDVSVIKAPLYNRQRDVNGVLGVFWDISLRKQAERALHESEKRFRELVELLPQSIFEFGLGGRILFANQSALHTFGYHQEDLDNGLNIRDLLAEEDHQRVRADIAQADDRPRRSGTEYTARHRDGRHFPVIAYTNPIRKGGHTIGIRGIVIDLTDIRNLEKRLNIAQKMEAVGQLAGGVAHDLNNLLSPILGYAEILLDDIAPQDSNRPAIQSIQNAGQKARDLVQQLLAFARKQPLQITTIDLNQIVSGFETLLRRSIREDILIAIDLTEVPALIQADAGQIEQVIMNLAVNAQDAMPKGGHLTLETAVIGLDENYVKEHPGVTPGRHVMLSLSDTGQGIPHAHRERIFDPFFTTKERDKGTGLGLSTVYGIVKQHQGDIWLYSEPDQGTTFKIFFPAANGQAKPIAAHQDNRQAARGTETIMVVEDNAMLRDMAQKILERHGYNVLVAGNGEDCLQRLTTHDGPVHLLLTDVVMPEMNGRELYARLAPLRPDLKVLYMSGYTDNVILQHGVLEADIDFIQKPFSVQGLANKIRMILDRPTK
jgi:two-component system, cell cycle sensor histidine kinase and response regulator CckA